MRTDITFDKEFDRFYRSIPEDILKLNGISKELMDVGEMSHNYFTNNWNEGGKIDHNANSNKTCVVNYASEVVKPLMKLEGVYLLHRYLRKSMSSEKADRIIMSVLSGDMYVHDFSGIGIQQPYCFAFSTHWILENGTPFGQLPSTPPMHTRSFIGQVAEMVMSMSQQFAGATAPADVLVAYAHLAKKEGVTAKEIENDLQSLVHILNKEFRGGSQCVTEDTEVLTPNGFKKYDELFVGDDIYTWDDGHLNIQKVQRVNIYEHDGEMHVYSGTGVEQVVSPNHRVLYKKYNSDEYCLTESYRIINNKTPVSIPVAMLTDTREDYPISDDMLKMCVFILTDGSYRQKSSALRWYKSPRRWGADEFENVCERLGFTYKTSTRPDGFDNGGNIVQYDIPSIYGECIREHIPYKSSVPEWMFNLSKRQANIVIDLWAKLDGHTSKSGRQKLQCDNYDIADAIQHICFLSGRGSSIQERYVGNNRSPTIYVVPYKNKNKTASTMDTIEYNGKIWCPTTEDGVVVFRKNGKIFISGNSAYSNVSIFDRPGLEHLFGDMLYSDGTTIDIDYVMFVQEVFMEWFSRGVPTTGEPYRFPVVTVNISTDDDGNILDDDFVKLVSKYNLSTGCFNIHSGESSKIASCCRLTSSLEDMRKYNQDSFGNGGLNIGSTHVVTINLPRIAVKTNNVLSESVCEVNDEDRKRTIASILERLMDDAASILDTHRNRILSKRIEQGFFPLIDVGLVDVDTMFSTFGFTGVPEFVEILGYDITSEEGIAIAGFVMDKMDELSLKISDEYGYAFNVEEVPAESASVTLRDLDVLKYGDDYAEFIGKEMYSNQFIPLTYDVPIIDRVTITGQLMAKATGGAIMHLNLDERITNESTMENLIRWTISKGVQHFAINYGFSRCINGHSTPGIVDKCSDCSGEIEDYLTRIVGYFVPVKSWNKRRQLHDFPNRVAYYVNGDVE
jgi:anaerobic ribonucleoside-triphosphate reductase